MDIYFYYFIILMYFFNVIIYDVYLLENINNKWFFKNIIGFLFESKDYLVIFIFWVIIVILYVEDGNYLFYFKVLIICYFCWLFKI